MAHKLSASAINTFMKSPKAYYWRYIARLEPILPNIGNYDHDKLAGVLWAEFVHRFYNGLEERENFDHMMSDWNEQTQGWVPDKYRERLTKALESWGTSYYQMFDPEDGIRGKGKSELLLENDRFLGYLDGLSDEGVIHEVKSTSRSPQLGGQLWKVQNSLQVKLYAVLAQAKGIRIEFAFKDTPYALYRSPIVKVDEAQLLQWESELNSLADYIYSLGDDPNKYICSADGCCLTTKGVTSMCSYDALCDMGHNEITKLAYKPKAHRKS